MPRKTRTTSPSVLPLALLQFPCTADPAVNVRQALAMIRDAAGRGARLIVTPELFRSRYFPQTESADNFALAETIPGPTSAKLAALARQKRLWISASLFEKCAPGLYFNTTVTLSPQGKIVGKYRKMHIPDDPRFYEKYYFAPGDLGWQTVPGVGPATIGTLVCWDQWYPEAARLTALAGAQVLLYPTAIGWWHKEPAAAQLDAWVTIQRAHAIANGVFVAAVNRVGVEGELCFWGHSFVCDPTGTIIARAGANETTILRVDCDLTLITAQRHGWPFLRDRRIDAYGDIGKRWRGTPQPPP